MRAWRRFWRDETGASALEYGLIVGTVAIGTFAAFEMTGNSLFRFYETVNTKTEPVFAK
jgi:pilus assembly protein Flp/PilA